MSKSQEKLFQITKKIPNSPGIYFFVDKIGKILYIGKATSLKNRVKSYLSHDIGEKRSPLIEKMIGEASNIKFEKTDSVLEATILESRLIKKFSPPFNTADKDQKSWNYIVVTEEKFPRILMMREKELKFENLRINISETFGPFPHSGELKEALKIIRKIFPFRDKCGEDQPKPCFNYQIGLCPGICIGKISEKDYRLTINHLKTFFRGNKKRLLKELEKEMNVLAKEREFEKANEIKTKIFALKHINDIALIKKNNTLIQNHISKLKYFKIEAYDIAHISGSSMVGVMTVIEDGEAKKSDYRRFTIHGQRGADDTRALSEILTRRFKHTEWSLPDLIVLDGGTAQLNVAKKILELLVIKIPIVAVTKDERHKAKEIKSIKYEAQNLAEKHKDQILLANSEAHRFALNYHRKLRRKID